MMTNTETLHNMQAQLTIAKRDLSDFRAVMGTLAQTNYLPELATRLAELTAAVDIAEAAVVVAQAQLPDPRIAKLQAAQAAAQANVEHWRAQLEHWSAIKLEHEGPYIEARDHEEEAARFLMWHESNVLTQQLDLADLLPKQ